MHWWPDNSLFQTHFNWPCNSIISSTVTLNYVAIVNITDILVTSQYQTNSLSLMVDGFALLSSSFSRLISFLCSSTTDSKSFTLLIYRHSTAVSLTVTESHQLFCKQYAYSLHHAISALMLWSGMELASGL